MIRRLNPEVRFFGAVKVGLANTRECVGRENRIFYFTSGEATLVIAGKPYPVSKNTLAYVPSYTAYRFEFGTDADVSLVCINFDIEARGEGEEHTKPIEIENWNGDRSDGEELSEEFALPIVIQSAETVQKDINKLAGLFFAKEPYYSDFASLYMKKIILFAISRSDSDSASRPAVKIIEYLRENYRYNLKNSDLAKRFGYHPNHLNRVVKDYTGMPLKSYIISCRIAAAKEQLAATDEPITTISENCGFSSPSYFAEIFSRSEAMSPREYRNKLRCVIV